jgi:hypothetical protein
MALSVKAFFSIWYAFEAKNRPIEQKTKGKNTGNPCIFSSVIISNKKFVINIRGTKNSKYDIIVNFLRTTNTPF